MFFQDQQLTSNVNLFTGDRLQNSDQDLALVVNAGEAIARTEEDEDD